MIETVVAAILLAVLVVPGAVATISYERYSSPRFVPREASERTTEFVIATAVLSPTTLLTVWPVWRHVLHVPTGDPTRPFENRLVQGPRPSVWWIVLPIVFIAVPAVFGAVLGSASARRAKRQLLAGDPRSFGRGIAGFDVMFADPNPRLVVVRLRQGGTWTGGLFGTDSWASPRVATTKEIVLEATVQVDDNGCVVWDPAGESPVFTGGRMLISLPDVDVVRFEEVIRG